jgi:Flp pilus assembly protein TadG
VIKRFIKCPSWAKGLEDERGAALVELAFCLFLLLILVFGIIDFSQMILDHQEMCGLARQGSNLALRGGMTPAEVVTALEVQGAPLNIGTQGRIIVTVVWNDSNGNPTIKEQAPSPTGIAATSTIGTGQGNPATVPAAAIPLLNSRQILYVTEVFYSYSPMTPVGGMLKKSLASTMYESAYF